VLDRTGAEQAPAGVFAFPACVGAETAVLMMVGVTLAFLGADRARGNASVELSGDDPVAGLSEPRDRCAGRQANASTV